MYSPSGFMGVDQNAYAVSIINYVGDFFPYGKMLREEVLNKERFLTTLHERDEETGLDYRGARYYDSDVARFLSLDPKAKEFAAWSPYNYVMGNPIMLIDPDRKKPKKKTFKTRDEAAKHWAKEYAKKSINKNREYASVIYSKEINGEVVYSYTKAKKGIGHFSGSRKKPRGTTLEASIHSHAAYDPRFDNSYGKESLYLDEELLPILPGVDANNNFSGQDRAIINGFNY